ncbi:hypothetical protein K466DRAFT_571372, partial [Polyporus arcularius HHB13444]
DWLRRRARPAQTSGKACSDVAQGLLRRRARLAVTSRKTGSDVAEDWLRRRGRLADKKTHLLNTPRLHHCSFLYGAVTPLDVAEDGLDVAEDGLDLAQDEQHVAQDEQHVAQDEQDKRPTRSTAQDRLRSRGRLAQTMSFGDYTAEPIPSTPPHCTPHRLAASLHPTLDVKGSAAGGIMRQRIDVPSVNVRSWKGQRPTDTAHVMPWYSFHSFGEKRTSTPHPPHFSTTSTESDSALVSATRPRRDRV